MSINLVEICRLKYPGQVEQMNITFRKPSQDILIDTWSVEGQARPSEESLLAESAIWEPIYELNQLKLISKRLIQRLLDTTAQSKDYHDALHCVSYALSTNTVWKAEAETFIAWRDDVYEIALQILSDVEGGMPVPTEQEFLEQLPIITWP